MVGAALCLPSCYNNLTAQAKAKLWVPERALKHDNTVQETAFYGRGGFVFAIML